MNKIIKYHLAINMLLFSILCQAAPTNTELSVWANEAIVATYTYDYKTFLPRQKEIAKYFTAKGWTDYSNALNASQLPDAIKKNAYFVSAVAILPPEIKPFGSNAWVATMPLLVVYKNPQYQQKQTLGITLYFKEVSSGQGVRGLAIDSLQTKKMSSPCQCKEDVTTNANLSSKDEIGLKATTTQR